MSGVAPLSVQFSNDSMGDFDTCYWDFGDSGGSQLCDADTHTYETRGSYTVSLTVSSEVGSNSDSRTDCIAVRHGIYWPAVLR
ncbi:MAG: PKD domain-containing protein [Candidatus Promineifilaceae bacterium]|nr:PKD domain-containing protein [Candidatus Promineifilaceae bacterium]